MYCLCNRQNCPITFLAVMMMPYGTILTVTSCTLGRLRWFITQLELAFNGRNLLAIRKAWIVFPRFLLRVGVTLSPLLPLHFQLFLLKRSSKLVASSKWSLPLPKLPNPFENFSLSFQVSSSLLYAFLVTSFHTITSKTQVSQFYLG